MIYLDSAAIVKLVHREQESDELDAWLAERIGIDATVRRLAASYVDPLLRSLDAVHLATAQVLTAELGEPPTAFVTYDKRLLAAASAVGLPTASPGAS